MLATSWYDGYSVGYTPLSFYDYTDGGGSENPYVDVDPSYIQLTCDGVTVTLRHPVIGNSIGMKTNASQVTLVDGRQIMYHRNEWGMSGVYQYNFRNLLLADAQAVVDFLNRYFGREVLLTEHIAGVDIHHNVIVTNTPIEYIVNSNCRGVAMNILCEETQLHCIDGGILS